MLALEQAQERVLSAVSTLPSETIPLAEADGRILSEAVVARIPLPPFTNSAMDGYAVRSADLSGASGQSPSRLRLVGSVAAGQTFSGTVGTGDCVRLYTGSPLPDGADAVVMQEDVRLAEDGQSVLVKTTPRPGEFVRVMGGDVKPGTALAGAGDALTPGSLSLLAAVGFSEVRVNCRPQVGLVATGNELVAAGSPLAPGCIYESSVAGLAALIRRWGGLPVPYELVPDAPRALGDVIARAASAGDAVVTCGGASVGDHDHVRSAGMERGGVIDFWRIAMKPGKPFIFGTIEGRPLFGLPGNPVSAHVTALLLLRPAVRRFQGACDSVPQKHPGVLAEELVNPGDRRHFMRVSVDGAGLVRPTGLQASHALASLSAANGVVDVPAGGRLAAGATVDVLRWW